MSDDLPMGWVETEIGEISQLISGKTPKDVAQFVNHTGSIPWVKVSDMNTIGNERYISKSAISFSESEAQKLGLPIVPLGSVIFPKNGGAIATGKKRQTSIPCSIDLNTMAVVPKGLDQDFLFYWFKTLDLASLSDGSVVPQINKSHISPIKISLPPLNEQRRIVDKLDRIGDRHRTARNELNHIPKLIARYKQAVLAAACSGKLTEDWREKNPNVETASELLRQILIRREQRYKEKYDKSKLENKKKPRNDFADQIPSIESEVEISIPKTWVITNIDYLAHVTKLAGFEYTEHFRTNDVAGIPIIRAQNVQMNKFIETNIKYISEDVSNYLERSQLHGREVLMVFIGAGTGNVCLAPQGRRWHLAPNVAKIDVDEISSNYLCLYLQSSIGQNYVDLWTKSTAQPSLSMETIRKIIVLLPPLEEQKEIVRRVEKMFEKIDMMEQEYQKATKLCDRLEQATLAKAFRGELVPQDPDDEPASVLLEQVKSQKEKGKKGK